MARGSVVGEQIVSQANTEQFRDGYERTFGERKPQRGRWIYDSEQGRCVPADEYRAPAAKCGTGIMADRVHEGTFYDDGERVVDIGSRQKRRAFMRERGVQDATDCSKAWLESRHKSQQRELDRRVDGAAEQAMRKLYQQGKVRD